MESNSRKTQILKEIFGYDSFRKGQEEIVDQILNGKDVLAIMPTGAGKSLCYQVPALLMSGITIVVSPLISLMIDQVKALNEAGVHAAYINSALTERQITKALELAAAGRYKMIYVAPERLLTPRFLDFACHTEGTGFPPKLCEDHRIHPPASKTPGCQCIYSNSNTESKRRYS